MTSDSRLPYVWLIVHVAAIAAATTFLAVVIHEPVVDANIGAGFAMLALAALGMPWSLLVFSGVIPEGRDFAETSLFIAFALANVLIHGLLALWLTKRRHSN